MHCPECSSELISKSHKGLKLQTCPSCQGMFILQEELRMIEKAEDPAVAWLDLELWRHREKYEALKGSLACPSCAGPLHTLSYPDSEVQSLDEGKETSTTAVSPSSATGRRLTLLVCHECRAVWLNEKMLHELHTYLEKRISSETVAEYLKDISHEILEVLKGKESLKSLGIILKLLQYRIFAQLPFIKKMIQNLPKV